MEVEQPVGKLAYRLPELIKMLGISKPSIYRLIKDNQFPKPVKLGNSSVWPTSTVHLWWDRHLQQVSQ